MLQFHEITMADKEWVSAYYKKKDFRGAQYSFAANYIWKKAYKMQVCEDEGYFFLMASEDEEVQFRNPIGFDGEAGYTRAVEKIAEYCTAKKLPIVIYDLEEEDKQILTQMFGSKVSFSSDRDYFEYIYSRELLADLEGKKLHGKRTHIRRFMETEWKYEPMTKQNAAACLDMLQEWCIVNDCKNDHAICVEGEAAKTALSQFEELGLRGGVLYQYGKVVAFALGEKTNSNTFAVHFEKAFADIQGAYPAINQMFVQHEMSDCEYVNREEDTGEEGLRKAKLSYYPEELLELYRAEISN